MNFTSLLQEYPYRTELHTHTAPVSACSHLSPEELVERYLALGCDALCITNHLNPLWSDGDSKERAKEYLADYYAALEKADGSGLRVILGVEIRFPENNNDYLVCGVSPEEIASLIRLLPYGIERFYKETKNDRNVILQAHPFRKGMVLAPLSAIDGVESMNLHEEHNSAVARAARYARDHQLLVCGGSDCHKPGQEGACLVRTQVPLQDSYDVAKVIRERALLFDLSGHIIIPYLHS